MHIMCCGCRGFILHISTFPHEKENEKQKTKKSLEKHQKAPGWAPSPMPMRVPKSVWVARVFPSPPNDDPLLQLHRDGAARRCWEHWQVSHLGSCCRLMISSGRKRNCRDASEVCLLLHAYPPKVCSNSHTSPFSSSSKVSWTPKSPTLLSQASDLLQLTPQ